MTPGLIERLVRSPRTLFLMDGAGALVTALLVGVLLPALGEHTGTPRPVLRALALTAAVLVRFRTALHALDWLYFVGEIAVVAALVMLELRVARAGAA